MHRVRRNRLVKHRPFRHRRDFLKELFGRIRQRTSLFTCLLIRQLDEAFVTICQYLREREDLMFRQQIGNHWRPVIIALNRFLPQHLG